MRFKDENGGKYTILLVDDSPAILFFMSSLLKNEYIVKIASSGGEALTMLRDDGLPDLILLDVSMPEMNGYEFLQRIKANPDTKNVPVMFLTANSDPEDEAKGFELGAVDYITKPVSPPIVKARVASQISLKAAQDLSKQHLIELETEKKLLEIEQLQTEKLMLNILPRPIAERLKRGDKNISGSYPEGTILFSDLVAFTNLSSDLKAAELVQLLNDLFSRFDHRAEILGLEKIKTIGDSYMAAGGIPIPRGDHAEICADMAIGMFEDLQDFNAKRGLSLQMRIGLSSGSVVAGVIGSSKFSYDLWGATVNTASRMESTCETGKIQVSESTYELLKNSHSLVKNPELVPCKGIGSITTFTLLSKNL